MPDPALLERISIDPAICGGKPCVRGHRTWVALVLGMLAEGASVDEILAEYPGLEELLGVVFDEPLPLDCFEQPTGHAATETT